MAKKDDFNFDIGSKPGFSLDFLKNLTKKQKETILIAVIAVAVLAIVVVAGVLISMSGAGSSDIIGGGNDGNVDDGGIGDGGGDDGGGDDGESLNSVVTSISVSSKPDKTSYYVGDSPNFSGLQIMFSGENVEAGYVSYDNDNADLVITGFDSSVPVDEQVITVEYKGCTTSFMIKVLEIPLTEPTLESIYLDPAPRDTAKANVALSVKDARIVCVYSDGSEKSIPLIHKYLYGYEDALVNGQVGDVFTVYVRYSENGYVAETSYTVTIIE